MHIAEVVTIAKSLPLLRLNTYKSLILSYSADYRRIFAKKQRRDESGSRRDFPVVPSGAVRDEPFGDLHRVQSGTLADLIADAPEREAVGRG